MKWLVAALVLAAACTPPSPCGPSTGTVDRVVDGDTAELDSGVKLRFVLVDTPETTQGKNDCYGQEAKARTRELIEGKRVDLSYDDAQCQDRFGRTLAYVKVGAVDVNATLVKEGLACADFIPPAGTSRSEEFLTYEAEAKTNRTGLWGACTVIPCSK